LIYSLAPTAEMEEIFALVKFSEYLRIDKFCQKAS